MAGQIPLDTRYYPSDFGVVREYHVVATSGVSAIPMLYADRDLVIDSVLLFVSGGVAITTNPMDMKMKQMVGATAPTFTTTAQDVGSFTSLAVATTTAATQSLAFTATNGTPNNNIVPTGSWLWFQTTAAGSIGNSPSLVVQVRYRSQR